jgi:hypothetical protein
MDKGTDLIFPPANKSTSFTKIRIYTTNLPPSSHKWKKNIQAKLHNRFKGDCIGISLI